LLELYPGSEVELTPFSPRIMKSSFCTLAATILLVTLAAQVSSHAQGAVFTYQGRLTSGSTGFTGSAEFQPTLWDAATGGTQVPNNPPTVIVSVTNGLFVLPLDFGNAPFSAGAERWLQLQVRTTIGPYTTLTPRQQVTPTPYAIHSANAATATTAATANSVSAANITGTLGLAQLPGSVVTNNQTAVNLTGSFAGDGGALSNLSAAALTLTSSNVSITSWGNNENGQRNIPFGLGNVLALSGSIFGSIALKSDGTVVAWGSNDYGLTNVPPALNNVTAIAAGYVHNLALKTDGTVVAWGSNVFGTVDLPPGLNNVAQLSAGAYQSIAVKNDGSVVVWGTNNFNQAVLPAGLTTARAVSAGGAHNLALKLDGTVVAWGAGMTNDPSNGADFGQSIVPPGLNNVIAISAGFVHSLALKSDGTVVAWGAGMTNDPGSSSGAQLGQSIVPPGLSNVVAIAAGLTHSIALKRDGTVVVWGGNQAGQTNAPPGLNNVLALGSGSSASHILVLRKRFDGPLASLNSDNTFNGNIEVNGDLRVSGDLHLMGSGGFRLNDGNLWLRSGADQKNGLGWYGPEKPFSFSEPDGPVLFGASGGALGTSSTNGQNIGLSWDNLGRVGIGTTTPSARLSLGSDSANTKLLLADHGGGTGIGLGVSGSQMRFHLAGGGGGGFSFLNSLAGTEIFTIQNVGSSAQVGIGTAGAFPQARLDVRGDIRLGSTGQYYAPGAQENLRIIRGVVRFDGVILAGQGFTVSKVATGGYVVTFTQPFSDMPAVTATVQFGLARIVTSSSVTASVANFGTFDANGTAVDQWFHFIAIGPR
jgi:hypothetical protein